MLTDSLLRSEVSKRIDSAICSKEVSHLRSIQGRGARTWINDIPISQRFALKPKEFQLATFLRLGLPVDSSKWITRCDCEKDLDSDGYPCRKEHENKQNLMRFLLISWDLGIFHGRNLMRRESHKIQWVCLCGSYANSSSHEIWAFLMSGVSWDV